MKDKELSKIIYEATGIEGKVVNGISFHGPNMRFRKFYTEQKKKFFKDLVPAWEAYRVEEDAEELLLLRMIRILDGVPVDPSETELAEARQKFRQSFKTFLREMLDEIEREDNN